MGMKIANPPAAIEQTCKAERCTHCGAPLHRDSHGHLRYWSELRPGADGWPISVKVCRDCRAAWPEEEDRNGRNQ